MNEVEFQIFLKNVIYRYFATMGYSVVYVHVGLIDMCLLPTVHLVSNTLQLIKGQESCIVIKLGGLVI